MASPFSIYLITFIIFISQISNVKSESFSFNFPRFETGALNILVNGDANTTGGVLQLTKKDQYGNPTPQSVGLSAFYGVLHLFDTNTGKVSDFETEFSFAVNTKGAPLHGDGFTFYLASQDFDFPDNSSGGFLGLFNEKTAFNTSLNQVVAVEFDTFVNSWDPNTAHIGIDINSLRSVTTTPWPLDSQPHGSIARARISYQSSYQLLRVSVDYPNSPVQSNATLLSYPFNLGAVLSEYVLFGFTATTGNVVETHDILSWSFTSFLSE